MASPNAGHSILVLALLLCFSAAYGQLSDNPYASACPSLNLTGIVHTVLAGEEPRMGASLLRLFFHDCFPQGCDASVLLVNDTIRGIVSEQDAGPNKNSLRGFDVIDKIKTAVEANCSGVVSCADILAVAAREAVILLGGQAWKLRLGRHDSLNAFKDKANSDLPGPLFKLQELEKAFGGKGFTPKEMVALSGGHTIGMAQCGFQANPSFSQQLQCKANPSLVPLDKTTRNFDTQYYGDLVSGGGVLGSDRALMTRSDRASEVKAYSTDRATFFADFGMAMSKMSEMGVLTGAQGQIRRNCKRLN